MTDFNKRFFHWCCNGLNTDLLFANTQEFIAGMNRIAVCWLYCSAKGRPVKIIAFCLLNNHFHFVLYGTEEDCELFMEHYRFLTLRWIQAHRGERLHDNIDLGHWPSYNPETVRNKVVYTLRQTLEAGYKLTPQGYPWSSAQLLFNDNSFILESCTPAGKNSVRNLRKLMSSEIPIPSDWRILPNGMIWPGDYIDVKCAESLFAGVKDYMFCLNNGNIDRDVKAEMSPELPSIPDIEVNDKAISLAKGFFSKQRISECSATERIQIARYLRKELRCGHKQIARIVKMNESDLRKSV